MQNLNIKQPIRTNTVLISDTIENKLNGKIENRANNPTKDQTTSEDREWVFNTTRKYRTQRPASADPETKLCTSSVIMDVIMNFEMHEKNLRL